MIVVWAITLLVVFGIGWAFGHVAKNDDAIQDSYRRGFEAGRGDRREWMAKADALREQFEAQDAHRETIRRKMLAAVEDLSGPEFEPFKRTMREVLGNGPPAPPPTFRGKPLRPEKVPLLPSSATKGFK